MSSERSPPVLDLSLGPSRSLALLTTLVDAGAIAALAIGGLPPAVKAAGIAAVFALWAWSVSVHCLRLAPFSVCRVVLDPEGGCVLVDRRGRTRDGELLPGAWIGMRLVALRVRLRRGRPARALALAADAVPADDFRRLRVSLRVSPPVAEPGLAARLKRVAGTAIRSKLRVRRGTGPGRSGAPENQRKS